MQCARLMVSLCVFKRNKGTIKAQLEVQSRTIAGTKIFGFIFLLKIYFPKGGKTTMGLFVIEITISLILLTSFLVK